MFNLIKTHFYLKKCVEYYKRYGIGYDAIRRKDDVKDLCHPNEFGHKIIAEAISKELKKNRFIF